MIDRRFADVSEFQPELNAHRYRAAGPRLIAVKATQGTDWTDPTYIEKVTHAHEAGLLVWHYHFADVASDPGEDGEAAHFWRTVKPHFHPGDRLVLDIEQRHPDGAEGLIGYTRKLDSRLHNISAQAAIGYTFDALLRETGPGWQVISGDWWIANYGGRVRRLGAGRRMLAQQTAEGHPGEQATRFPGIGYADVDRLQLWYALRLSRQLRRRA